MATRAGDDDDIPDCQVVKPDGSLEAETDWHVWHGPWMERIGNMGKRRRRAYLVSQG